MPRRCVAAGCDTKSGMGYSLHGFPQNEALRKKWVLAVKRQRSNWDGPSSSSQLCSKHFEDHCFVTEGVRYRESMGVPALKRLKPDAVPTLFPRSIDYLQGVQCLTGKLDNNNNNNKEHRALQGADHCLKDGKKDL